MAMPAPVDAHGAAERHHSWARGTLQHSPARTLASFLSNDGLDGYGMLTNGDELLRQNVSQVLVRGNKLNLGQACADCMSYPMIHVLLRLLHAAAFPGSIALVSHSVSSKMKRSVAIGIQVGVGGLTGNFSSNILLPWAAAALNWYLLFLANRRNQAMIASGEAAAIPREVLARMDDRSPYFM